MTLRKHRARRVRDEMRLWLRNRHGISTSYSRAQIEHGARSLGLNSADDLMLAYTLFGADLSPVDMATFVEPAWLASAFDDATMTFDLLTID